MKDAVEQFFRMFEANSREDVEASAAQFADVFLLAAPDGSRMVRADELAKALPKRKQLFDALGVSTVLVTVAHSRLSDRYVMATTQWKMTVQSASIGVEPIILQSTFVVDVGAVGIKIVLYLPHQDVFAELRERNLLPTP